MPVAAPVSWIERLGFSGSRLSDFDCSIVLECGLLTIDSAAGRLGIGRTLMRALVAADEVESVKIGRLRRIPEDALGAYIHHLRTLGTVHHHEEV